MAGLLDMFLNSQATGNSGPQIPPGEPGFAPYTGSAAPKGIGGMARPDIGLALMGFGHGMSALGMGQAPNLAPYASQIMALKQRGGMNGPGGGRTTGGGGPTKKDPIAEIRNDPQKWAAFLQLAEKHPELAEKFLYKIQLGIDLPEPESPLDNVKIFGGVPYTIGPDGQPGVASWFQSNEKPGFRPTTEEEAAAYGGPGQIGPDNRYYPLDGGPSWRPATAEEAAEFGAVAGKINETTGDFVPINPPSNTSIEVGPDGKTRVVMGPGAVGGGPDTEGERAAAGYLGRMRAAEEVLSSLSEDGDTTRSIPSLLFGGTMAEGWLSPEQKQLLQAQRDWVRAKLRKESGAVIAENEMAEEVRTYFPMPGDDDATIEQKRRSRLQAERQLEYMSGRDVDESTQPGATPGQGGDVDISAEATRILGMNPSEAGEYLPGLMSSLSTEEISALTAEIEKQRRMKK